ncbi:MAG: NAD(P)H-dependent oxidoreductase [Ascidiaceihabitans sp.]|nr:NAD(P)H-dependent oxidoreductase [Ascidiaceihabitans sp.]
MTHILQIDSSGRTSASVSRQLSAQIVEKLGGQTTHRDLLTHPLPQLDEAWLGANWTPADQLTEQQAEKLATSDSLIQEIKDADTLVIGVSMYNFGIPASLKAWVDLVCRAGHTFQYTEKGPVGLMEGKRAIVVIASGGVPLGSPMDHAGTYMTTMLGFIGITDVTFVAAEGTTGNLDAALKGAQTQIDAIAA